MVGFRSVYVDADMASATSPLTFALGRDVSGKPYAVDLGRMPHLLIAGATGSGKSVCVNAIITSILMRAKPTEVRFVLIDLKRVELAPYGRIPHLLTDVIMEAYQARAALAWAVGEMEDRYKKLARSTSRNIAAYNASPGVAPEDRMPYIVLMIDELADLMIQEGRKVEEPVVKLAQKARAVGIHLVLATQRPSVNVVTGLIKANVPSRIAFAMASMVDSRTVLDAPGAEDLIGRGDMLYQPADLPRPVRIQGVFVSDAEVQAVTEHWRTQEPTPLYDPDVLAGTGDGEDGEGGEFAWLAKIAEDELTPRAAELVLLTGKASTSMMQTKLKVGFNRAQPPHGRAGAGGHRGAAGPAQPGRAADRLRPGELAALHGGRGRPLRGEAAGRRSASRQHLQGGGRDDVSARAGGVVICRRLRAAARAPLDSRAMPRFQAPAGRVTSCPPSAASSCASRRPPGIWPPATATSPSRRRSSSRRRSTSAGWARSPTSWRRSSSACRPGAATRSGSAGRSVRSPRPASCAPTCSTACARGRSP